VTPHSLGTYKLQAPDRSKSQRVFQNLPRVLFCSLKFFSIKIFKAKQDQGVLEV